MNTSDTDRDRSLREHICYLLRGGDAHVHFPDVVARFPADLINSRIGNLPYTPWQVLEHMRIAQWDILEFSRNANHVSPKFPEGYWPAPSSEADGTNWQKSIDAFKVDLKEMHDLVMNPATDLFTRIPHGDGQTILRQALLVADHNAYHLGTLMTMKKVGLTEGSQFKSLSQI